MPTWADSPPSRTIRRTARAADSILFVSVPTPIGRIHLAATPRGLARIVLPTADAEQRVVQWVAQHFPAAKACRGVSPILRKASTQIESYFTGSLREFSLPLDLVGTPFQTKVWRAVATIPFAETHSYREVAEAIGNPRALRAVGAAQGANPIPIVVPCHRVIGSNGTLTGYGGGLVTKRWLLDHERELAGMAPDATAWSPPAAAPRHLERAGQLSFWSRQRPRRGA